MAATTLRWQDPHSEGGITTLSSQELTRPGQLGAIMGRSHAVVTENHYTHTVLLQCHWSWQEYVEGPWKEKKLEIQCSSVEKAKELAHHHLAH